MRKGRLQSEEEFGDIIVKTNSDGAVTRLRDIARLELGAADYSLRSLLDNKDAVAVPIFAAPGSNAIAISNGVRATMADIKKAMPDGVDYEIVYDPTQFVRASIESVVHTLLEAVALVVLVVILFLQTWRASIIPLIAVPVAVVGTFGVMHVFGFSINALSLFGLVLAIGIVVDDAIVVVENVERNIEAGLSPREATYQAMREVSGPIVAIALVLIAVFVPLAFISGLSGQFYKQFALTIAISTVISAINSLTLSPALASLLLKERGAPKDALTRGMDRVLGRFFGAFNRLFKRGATNYSGGVTRAISRKAVMFGVYVALAFVTAGLFKAVPGGFVPAQDKQYLIGFAQLPDGATLDRTEDVIRRMGEIAMKQPGVEHAVAFPGLSISGFTNSSSSGIVFTTLKPFDQRRRADQSAAAIAGQLNQKFGAIQDAFIVMFPPPPVQGIGTDRRLQAAARGPRLARLRCARRRVEGLHGQGGQGARARRDVLELPGQRAAALRRHRPHQGASARRAGDRGVRHDADLPRQPLRQRLQQVWPHVLGAGPGRRGASRPRRRHRRAEGALDQRRDGAALGADEGDADLRPRARHALQRLSLGRRQRRRGARLFVGPGAGRDQAHRRRNTAARDRLRVDRAHVPGDPGRQLGRSGSTRWRSCWSSSSSPRCTKA
jgi:hydrophobe/amphiphile efflux-1 (HAE1) family protein